MLYSCERDRAVVQVENTLKANKAPPLLFEMAKTFVELAETLNLEHTKNNLGVTRQTVKRHLSTLEEEKGGRLFEIRDRQYTLTKLGAESLEDAKEIVASGLAWLTNETGHHDGLLKINIRSDTGFYFSSQAHSLTRLWKEGPETLQNTMKLWTNSAGALFTNDMQEAKSRFIIYRKLANEWICTEIGAQSYLAAILGPVWAMTSVGRPLTFGVGSETNIRTLRRPFDDVAKTQGAHYDVAATRIELLGADETMDCEFERLILGAHYPDYSPALIVDMAAI